MTSRIFLKLFCFFTTYLYQIKNQSFSFCCVLFLSSWFVIPERSRMAALREPSHNHFTEAQLVKGFVAELVLHPLLVHIVRNSGEINLNCDSLDSVFAVFGQLSREGVLEVDNRVVEQLAGHLVDVLVFASILVVHVDENGVVNLFVQHQWQEVSKQGSEAFNVLFGCEENFLFGDGRLPELAHGFSFFVLQAWVIKVIPFGRLFILKEDSLINHLIFKLLLQCLG